MRLFFVTSLLCIACGGAEAPVKSAMTSPAPTTTGSQQPEPGLVTRSQVRLSVREGFGTFLRSVEVEPAFRDGAFIGFQLKSVRDPARWRGIDLKPGDVVSRVNGQVIEHPEDALKAFKMCETAKQIEVMGERNGTPHNVVIPIVEDAR
jgi:type II secretory pathway component PulC